MYVARASGATTSALRAPAAVRVEALPHSAAQKAGVVGLLLRVARTDSPLPGPVNVTVDYSGFRWAYGADWASRLRVEQLPVCALTSPGAAGCVGSVLPSRNSLASGTVSADVTVAGAGGGATSTKAQLRGDTAPASAPGTLLAVTAGPSGGAGDFAASSLAPASSWGHGGATGGFTWSYPMQSPPALGGPAPSLGLSYSSQSVDGRHAATNNQPGWIGEGFDYHPGFIERRYKACADDMGGTANNTERTGDLCWGAANAVLSLGGSSTELIRGSDGRWHPRREDGSKIELLSGATNGDNNGEHWKVTTADGTQYWFGRHQLPGWTTGKATTDSVLTVPVFGNNPGEACNQPTFAASSCNQGWRWNLDYVQDVHGNTMSLWWSRETNHYAKNLDTDSPVPYHRGGVLSRIDYGTDSRSGTDTVYTTTPVPARVEFTPADRCLSSCTVKDEAHWPDTPFDQECLATTNPCLVGSPTFWSTKRLSVVTTKVWKAAAHQPVQSWTLRHTFPDPGDGTRAGLWLAGITQRGLNGGTVTLPEVTFAGIQMNNRVDASGGDFAPAMNWWRVGSIRTETGGEIVVTYSARECVAGGLMPAAEDNNRLRCFPAKWTPQGFTEPVLDHFHKYVVTEVQQIDHTGGAEPLKTRYEYRNPANLPLWHFDDDDGLVPANRKSWGQWRGYPTVVTRVGEGTDETRSETLYFRGMHGDKLAAGSTRSVSVTGREGGAATDFDHFAGMPREQITWLGAGVLSAVVTDPWRSDPTATRTGTPPVEARFVRVATTRGRVALDGGTWRRTTSTTAFDSVGMPVTVDDRGDDSTDADDRCVATEYARNTTGANWLLTPVRRVHGWADDCATAATTAAQVTADTRFSFDDLAFGATSTRGAVTRVEHLTGFTSGTRTYQQSGTARYDGYGRLTESTDIAGERTTTAFTPATGPVTQTVVTNPLLWTETTELDPAYGLATKVTDPNNRVTEVTYDGLGRTTAVWLPSRLRTGFPNDPSTGYTYTVSTSAPSSVTTRTVNANNGYDTAYHLVDALGRDRQTQTAAFGSGRIITDAFYDSAGRVWKANSAYFNSGTAGTTLFLGLDADMPSQTRTEFDAAGRPTASILFAENVEKWRTTTAYHGDHVDTTPPAGGTATTVWTDVRGNTTALWQYHGATPSGGHDETRYTYHPAGQLATVVDPSGNTWSYDYDIQGRQISADDPDKGESTVSYNSFGDAETVTDVGRGITLAYTYDRLGRPTSLRDGSITGAVRASWTYDLPAKGLTRSASRFVGGNEYKTETLTVDAMYRPTQTRVTIPTAEGNLAGAYAFRTSYTVDGSPNTLIYPAAGGLNAETVTYDYDSDHATPDMLATNYGDATHYVIQAAYTNLFEPTQTTRATALTGAPFMQSGQSYDPATGRITRRFVGQSKAPFTVVEAAVEHDPAGNITKIDDNTPGGRDTQCFSYDHLRRLTEAWTPASADCAAAPTAGGLGGPAPYWHSWDFGAPTDPVGRVGNRLTQVEHATATGDVTTTYTYPSAGANQPHTLTRFTRTDNAGTTTGAYTYDSAGNTTGRPGSNGQQTLTWDAEGHLATLADTAGSNSYVYDAGGNRLISRDPAGVTLHLGLMELRLTGGPTGTVTATRYYEFNGETVAQRTSAGIMWLAEDHQGTAQVAVTADSVQTVTRRRQTPYGTPRGAQLAWPNPRGFVGGFQDRTGLTHLGAREYDPTTGRFISVDPIIDHGDPQQMHGFAYAGNTPITASDPSGLIPDDFVVDPYNPKGGQCTGSSGYKCWQEWMAGTLFWGCEGKAGKTPSCPTKSKVRHDNLDICGTVLPYAGVACDGANAVLYYMEGDYTSAAVSVASAVPVLDIVCKFKAICKKGADWVVDQGKKLLGRGARGVSAETSRLLSREAADLAAEKALGRTAKRTAPTPAPAKPAKSGPAKTSPASSSCAKHSFAPGTKVLMADGSTKPIEGVREGDYVLATDPETGKTEPREVTATHTNLDTDLTNLTITLADGTSQTLHTTDHHPFWLDNKRIWANAADLRPGDTLRATNSTGGHVAYVRSYTGRKVMHDLTVDSIHTYYVLAGGTPVLVHNCDPVSIYKAPGKGMTQKLLDDGFSPDDFPGSGNGYPDGRAYFGLGEKGKAIAQDYASRGGYDGTVIHIRIPRADFDLHFGPHVGSHNGVPNTEVAVPNTMFGILNRFRRELL